MSFLLVIKMVSDKVWALAGWSGANVLRFHPVVAYSCCQGVCRRSADRVTLGSEIVGTGGGLIVGINVEG